MKIRQISFAGFFFSFFFSITSPYFFGNLNSKRQKEDGYGSECCQ